MDYNEFKEWLNKNKVQKRLNFLAKKYKDKKVIIYGAGILSKVVFDNYDLSKFNIIAVADVKFYKGEEKFYDYKGICGFDVQNFNPDVIIGAVYDYNGFCTFVKECSIVDINKVKLEPIIKKGRFKRFIDYIKRVRRNLQIVFG